MRCISKDYKEKLTYKSIFMDGDDLVALRFDGGIERYYYESDAAEEIREKYLEDIGTYLLDEENVLLDAKTKMWKVRGIAAICLGVTVGAIVATNFLLNEETLSRVNMLLHNTGINGHYKELVGLRLDMMIWPTILAAVIAPTITAMFNNHNRKRRKEVKKLSLYMKNRELLEDTIPTTFTPQNIVTLHNLDIISLHRVRQVLKQALYNQKEEEREKKYVYKRNDTISRSA